MLDMDFQAYHLINILGEFDKTFSGICPNHFLPLKTACWHFEAAIGLNDLPPSEEGFTWATAALYLRDRGILRGDNTEALELQQEYLFCLIGVLTCLYIPSPPENDSRYPYQIVVASPTTHHRFWCFSNSHFANQWLTSPVRDQLSAIGDILPLTDKDGIASVDDGVVLDTAHFNANVMISVLKMKIIWTDIIGSHLDYDVENNTVFLFRQPTLCFLHAVQAPEQKLSILQRCVLDVGMDNEKLRGLMWEILLSIHVIFGQDPKSQHRLDEKVAFQGIPRKRRDVMLRRLCSEPWSFADSCAYNYQSKRIYQLSAGDFPILGPKLAYLSSEMARREPRSLWQLWKDQRNTLQWWTFWLVVIFGLISVILTVVQTVLSGLQLHWAEVAAMQGQGSESSRANLGSRHIQALS
ncbi:hypothetical protein NPX13_g3067 [Xylaria arbuscula]|uniref:Uncharacterized protein n=1 Tax=Xylaria arbuscula TaxID=114810 RepID=A0A9W8NIL6_9PEZI|nr:hypothetical protein NPX13_g3067 [Xylaria arbuscula]